MLFPDDLERLAALSEHVNRLVRRLIHGSRC